MKVRCTNYATVQERSHITNATKESRKKKKKFPTKEMTGAGKTGTNKTKQNRKHALSNQE